VKIVKIGGSVITDKGKYRTPREEVMESISKLLGEYPGRMALVHGAGSFGHEKALEFGLDVPGSISGKAAEISVVINDVMSLNSMFSEHLIRNGFRGVSIPPHAIYGSNGLDLSPVTYLLNYSFSPILFGDIIMKDGKYRIISGDELCKALAEKIRPDEVIMVTDVDGIYTSDPKEFSNARLLKKVKASELSLEGKGKDATGSMMGKVENIKTMLPFTNRVKVINGNYPDRLRKALLDEDVIGTVVF
jgi:isopentenyl phosphate kinase